VRTRTMEGGMKFCVWEEGRAEEESRTPGKKEDLVAEDRLPIACRTYLPALSIFDQYNQAVKLNYPFGELGRGQ